MHDTLPGTAGQPAMSAPLTGALPEARGPAGLIAFDFGLRYIGVAVGDTQTRLAHPLEFIDAEANAARFARVAALIAEWQPATLVVGLPLDAEGGDHDMTRRARRFAHQLEGRFRLPVVLVDERLTSAEADAVLRSRGRGGRDHKQDNHAIAAQLILQAYLDSLESPRA
jgi:putative Holliday junction resolvase